MHTVEKRINEPLIRHAGGGQAVESAETLGQIPQGIVLQLGIAVSDPLEM